MMIIENRKTARIAGLWWLLFCLIGPISYLVVDGKLLVPGNEAETITNINSDPALFWAGAIAFIAGYACFIILAKTLCKLFASVDTKLTRCMLCFVIAGTALVLIGKIAEIVAAYVGNAEDAAYLINMRVNIEMVGELFWGLWLIPLVILIFKSDLIPKAIGIALLAATAYHLIAFAAFFITGTDASSTPVLTILGFGEFAMVLWLLIKGVKNQKEYQRADLNVS